MFSFKNPFAKEKVMKNQCVIRFGNGSYFKASRKTKCVETLEEATVFDDLAHARKVFEKYWDLMKLFGAVVVNYQALVEQLSNNKKEKNMGSYEIVIKFEDGHYLKYNSFMTKQLSEARLFNTMESARHYVKNNPPIFVGRRFNFYDYDACAIEQKGKEMGKFFYAEVSFPFGTYTFKTTIINLKPYDIVLCEVRDHYQKGNFVQYVDEPSFKGEINKWIVMPFDDRIASLEETKRKYELKDFNPGIEYLPGSEAMFGPLKMRRTLDGWIEVK